MFQLRYKYLIATIFVLLFISSCSEKQADIINTKIYEVAHLSFSYPANWEVTEDIENEGVRFLFIESPGDAIIKVEVYDNGESFDLKEFVRLDIDAFKQEVPSILNLAEGKITPISRQYNQKEFNGYRYEFNISIANIDIPHVSDFFISVSPKKTAYITNQVAIEDLGKVSSGFKLVLSSFKLQ